jgi:glycosyltransferase involved in cell wall biosynthesis
MISICIPTRNRSPYLASTIKRITSLVESRNAQRDFEIIVSNNASDDDTERILMDLSKSTSILRWETQLQNIGFQRNVVRTIEMSKMPWVFITGDDDFFETNSIDCLLLAAKSKTDICVFNSDSGDGRTSLPIDDGVCLEIDSEVEAFQTLGRFHLTFMGNLLFKRESFLRHASPRDLLSVYPLAVVAWRILRESRATLLNSSIIRGLPHNRDWVVWQPVFTSIDMSRILTEGPFANSRLSIQRFRNYLMLLRSIPRAVFRTRCGLLPKVCDNPYRELSIRNLCSCFRLSKKAVLLAVATYVVSKSLPLPLLGKVLWEDKLRANLRSGKSTSIQ